MEREESERQLDADLDVVQRQLQAPEPRRSIIKAAFRSIGRMIEQAVGTAGGVGVLAAIQRVVHGL